MLDFYDGLTARLRAIGDWIWPTGLRLILFWEFWEAGITKLRGENWFADIPWADWQKGFPWPFDLLGPDLNWLAATWSEMVFAVLLGVGLLTRFAAVSLLVITGVATAAVHWPAQWGSFAQLWEGYVITADGAGNYKLPLLFAVMHNGRRVESEPLSIIRERCASELARLPSALAALDKADPGYSVLISPGLVDLARAVDRRFS